MEHRRCILPSISNLMGLADAGSQNVPVAAWPQSLPSEDPSPRESRPRPGFAKAFPPTQTCLPPSPPVSTSALYGISSPSQNAFGKLPTPSGYYYETTPPLESGLQQHNLGASPQPSHSHQPMYTAPTQASTGSYFPPMAPPSPRAQQWGQGISAQYPLPQSYPPIGISAAVTPDPRGISWQHHHYLNPAPGYFPHNQYICRICDRSFSRPSSLEIHYRSHTGEKPFKCPQAGCYKAFSVRSNMKRHDRGCHGD